MCAARFQEIETKFRQNCVITSLPAYRLCYMELVQSARRHGNKGTKMKESLLMGTLFRGRSMRSRLNRREEVLTWTRRQ